MNNIQKLAFTVITAFCFASCAQNSKGVIISGTIKNNSEPQAYLMNNGDTLTSIVVDENGNFQKEFESITDGTYFLKFGNTTTEIYLMQGDRLNIQVDLNSPEKSLLFEGLGAGRNNYLAEKTRMGEVGLLQYESAEFLNKYRERTDAFKDELRKHNIERQFVINEELNLDLKYYYYLFRLNSYVVEANASVQKDFDNLKLTEFDNPEFFHLKDYVKVLAASLLQKQNLSRSVLDEALNLMSNDEMKGEFVNSLGWAWWNNALLGGIDSQSEASKAVEGFIVDNGKLASYNPEPMVTGTLKTLREMEKSHNTKVQFSYQNIKGQYVSLSDFKGKYVYIDFWATWCGPCLKEMPGFDRLMEKYHNKNIEFIGLSIDKANKKDKWIETVKTKDIKGIQLNVDEDTKENDPFLSALNVNSYWLGIPQYALIDPDGRVISAMVPRPTDPRLDELLSSLLD